MARKWLITLRFSSHLRFPTKKKIYHRRLFPFQFQFATHLSVVSILKHDHPIFFSPSTAENLAILPPQTAVVRHSAPWLARRRHYARRATRRATRASCPDVWCSAPPLGVTRRRSLPSEGGISEAPAAMFAALFFMYMWICSRLYIIPDGSWQWKRCPSASCAARRKDTWVTDVQLGTTFYNPCKSRSIISTLVCAAAPTSEMQVTSQQCTKTQNVHATSGFFFILLLLLSTQHAVIITNVSWLNAQMSPLKDSRERFSGI